MRHVLTILAKLVSGLVLAVITLLCVAYFAANSSLASRAVAQSISGALPNAVVAVAGLEFDAVPVDVHVHGMALGGDKDGEAVWSAGHLGLTVDPWSLVGGDALRVERLQADGVKLRLVWDDNDQLHAMQVFQPRVPEEKEKPEKPPGPVRPVVIEKVLLRDASVHIERAGLIVDLEGWTCEGHVEAPTPVVEMMCGWDRASIVVPGGPDGKPVHLVSGPSSLGGLVVRGNSVHLELMDVELDGQKIRCDATVEADPSRPELLHDLDVKCEGALGTNVLAALGRAGEKPLPLKLSAREEGKGVNVSLQIGEARSLVKLTHDPSAQGGDLPVFELDASVRVPEVLVALASGGLVGDDAALSLRGHSDGARMRLDVSGLDIPERIEDGDLLVEAARLDELEAEVSAERLLMKAGFSVEKARVPAAEVDKLRFAVDAEGELAEGVLAKLRDPDAAGTPAPQDIEKLEVELTVAAARVGLAAFGVELEGVRLPKATATFSWQPAGSVKIPKWTVARARLADLVLSDATLSAAVDVKWPDVTIEQLSLSTAAQGSIAVTGSAQASFAGFQLSLPARFEVTLTDVALDAAVPKARDMLPLGADAAALFAGRASGRIVIEGNLKKPESVGVAELELTVARETDSVRFRLADEALEGDDALTAFDAASHRLRFGPTTLSYEVLR